MPTTFDPDAYLAQAPEQKPVAPPAFDPDVYLGGETIPQRQGVDLAAQYAGLFNRAVAPYVTAQAVAPVIGPLALGATDLSVGVGNAISRALGGPQLMSGSEAIRRLYPQAVFREPETGAQAIGVNALEAALGARGTANALSRVTQGMGPGTARQIVQGMADQPGAQSAAAASGAATQQAAYEYGEPGSNIQSPFVMPLLGVLGGLVGGTAALRGPGAIREIVGAGTPSTQAMRATARQRYQAVDASGVQFTPGAVNQFLNDLEARLVAEGYTPNQSSITAQLTKLNRLRDQPQSISQMDTIRSQVTKDLIKSSDENVRRLGREMADSIDDFVQNAPNSAFTGGAQNRAQALSDLSEARRLWMGVSKSEQMEELIRQARLEDKPLDEALRDKFRSLEQNQRKFNRFTPEEQQFIHNVVQGGSVAKGLTDFSEAMKLRQSLGGTVYAGIGGLATPIANQFGAGVDPYTALALAMGVAGGRKVIGGGANLLAAQRANQAAAAMRGFRRQPLSPLFMPSIQNVARQPIDFAAQSQALNALAQ
jgi:hypothetical protein